MSRKQLSLSPDLQHDCFARSSLPPRTLEIQLTELFHSHAIQPRDEAILLALRDLKIINRNQLHRLFWPSALNEETTRKRLSILVNRYRLLHKFTPAELNLNRRPPTGSGNTLPQRVLYTLSPGGRKWLTGIIGVSAGYTPKCNQINHDLWTAELCVRLTEAVRQRPGWRFTWRGEPDAAYYRSRNNDHPSHVPDGLAIIESQPPHQSSDTAFFIEMDASRETHRRLSSRIGRKIVFYDRFFKSNWRFHPALDNLPRFPPVLFVTHGRRRLTNLAASIKKHRRRNVVYALTLRENLLHNDDILTAPVWLTLFAQEDTPHLSLSSIIARLPPPKS